MKIKIIKTEKDYQDALALISELMAKDPESESEEGERLSLLATLVADYESKTFPITLPDPIDAIKFRMEQVGLKPADLIPYIGSRSRVSEILSGKRTLTIEMIRSLEAGLGIPAKALLKKPTPTQQAKASSQSIDERVKGRGGDKYESVIYRLRKGNYNRKIQSADYANTGMQLQDQNKIARALGIGHQNVLRDLLQVQIKDRSGWKVHEDITPEMIRKNILALEEYKLLEAKWKKAPIGSEIRDNIKLEIDKLKQNPTDYLKTRSQLL